MLLKTEATAILRRAQLPAIAQHPPCEDSPYFTNEDILRIIDHIINRGNRYAQLRKNLDPEEALSLERKMLSSSFVKIIVRKIVIKMGEQRRLGKGLRGFSKLLLEEIENDSWPIIMLQKSLVELQRRQSGQLQALSALFARTLSEEPSK